MATYYNYNTSTKQLTPAKRVLDNPDGSRTANPTPEQYAAIGAHPRADDPAPTPPEGKVAIPDGYELRDNAWHRVWRYEDAPPPPPRVYDKYELVMAIERAGFLEDFVSLIRSDPVLELKWNAADYLDFSDGTLQSAIDAIKESLGVTDEQVEAVLAQAEVQQ